MPWAIHGMDTSATHRNTLDFAAVDGELAPWLERGPPHKGKRNVRIVTVRTRCIHVLEAAQWRPGHGCSARAERFTA